MDKKYEKNDVLKTYKRFLKDNGCYYRVMSIHKKNKINLERITLPFNLISRSDYFCYWSNTKEGEYFWWNINNRWKAKCFMEKIGETINGEYYNKNRCIDFLFMVSDYLARKRKRGELSQNEKNEYDDIIYKLKLKYKII